MHDSQLQEIYKVKKNLSRNDKVFLFVKFFQEYRRQRNRLMERLNKRYHIY